MAHITLKKISKVFSVRGEAPVEALRELDLAVEARELLAVVGPSGSGKTTLLRLIAGLEALSTGTLLLDGKAANDTPPHARNVAMVFQNPALFPHMTVRENLGLGLRLRKMPRATIDQRVGEAAQLLQVEALLERKPESLSGGQAQRVALGRALATGAGILLLDEPLSQLDVPLRAEMRDVIRNVHRNSSATMVYVTHDQHEAMALGERIAVLNQGRLEQAGIPIAIYQEPATRFVAEFFGRMNFLSGIVVAGAGERLLVRTEFHPGKELTFDVPPQHSPALAKFRNAEILVGVRPEHVRLSLGAETGIAACVDRVELTGPDSLAQLVVGPHRLWGRVPAECKAGERVLVSVDATKARFFDPATHRALPGLPS
jgi:ABC-type sugar transport system ATPase subunit